MCEHFVAVTSQMTVPCAKVENADDGEIYVSATFWHSYHFSVRFACEPHQVAEQLKKANGPHTWFGQTSGRGDL
jgi:hypothetical protein